MFGAVRIGSKALQFALLFWAVSFFWVVGSRVSAEPEFAVPDGFVANIIAKDDLVHDAFTMTINSRGQPVVSGPGYIRTLIDDENDGIFDRYVTWTPLPVEGAQGLWSEGQTLFWVGDKGLWRSEDQNADLIGDAAPTQVLPLPTGGEHDAHAIRRGPDGYWYLIVGNYARDIQKINSDRHAAIAKPRAGTIWRISPDFSECGAWAHGLRNAYDFDFLANGQIVTFDSDEEREVTLPWYRPTRVLVVSPGTDAGWVDSAWFDIDSRVTMPQVISRLGRGSPTGVAVYHHHAFPQKYREAAFVLDWTFGRVIAVYPQPGDSKEVLLKPNRFMAETFMQATGTSGFAPTDVCVAPDGSLWVCVGGRGTSGAIYRIHYVGTPNSKTDGTIRSNDANDQEYSQSQLEALASILAKPNPWESWSSSEWKATLDSLPDDAMESIIDGRLTIESSDPTLAGQWRRRASQMLLFSGRLPSLKCIVEMLHSNCSVTRAAGWWLIGRSRMEIPLDSASSIIDQASALASPETHAETSWDHLLAGTAWRERHEALGLRYWPVTSPPLPDGLDWQQRNALRQIQLWALSRSDTNTIRKVSSTSAREASMDHLAAKLLFGPGLSSVDGPLMDRLALRASANQIGQSPQEILEALTLLQSSLGDFRNAIPLQQAPTQIHATDGYRTMHGRRVPGKVREGWAQWCMSLVTSTEHPDQIVIETEVLRTLAMLESESVSTLNFCLARIRQESHPTSDLHALVVLACCKAPRDKSHTAATARALPALLSKVESLGLNTDNSWTVRLEQIFKQLIQRDPSVPNYLLGTSSEILDANTVFWLEWCPANIQAAGRSRIIAQLANTPTKNWQERLVRFACKETLDIRLARKLRSEVVSPPTALTLELLSKSPSQEDYTLMLESLANGTRDLWPSAWKGLMRMPTQKPADELRTLALLWAKQKNAPLTEISIASLVARLRSNAWKLKIPNVPTKDGWDEWSVFFSKSLDATTLARLKEVDGPPPDWLMVVKASSAIAGDPSRGQALFQRAKCAQCHGGGNALGPSLTGIARRFSNEDLFRAIYEPSRDISDRYRSIKILTTDGEVLVGMLVYESTDGLTLQAADGKLLRINQNDIESKSTSAVSLMPSGLLDGVSANDLADLVAYLRRL